MLKIMVRFVLVSSSLTEIKFDKQLLVMFVILNFKKKNNQQYVDNALEKASKKHGKNQDADFDQKELDAKFKQNWPSQGL